MLSCFAWLARMLFLPLIQLLFPYAAKFLLRRRQPGFGFRATASLFVLLLTLHRLISRPASILFFRHLTT